MTLKSTRMIEKIKENEMTSVSSVDYVRGLKGEDSVLITLSSLMTQIGILHKSLSLSPGEQYELPYGSGLIMIQNASISYGKAVATILGDGTGIVIAEAGGINFFSEVEDRICVFSNKAGAKYVIKNTKNIAQIVAFTFIE